MLLSFFPRVILTEGSSFYHVFSLPSLGAVYLLGPAQLSVTACLTYLLFFCLSSPAPFVVGGGVFVCLLCCSFMCPFSSRLIDLLTCVGSSGLSSLILLATLTLV